METIGRVKPEPKEAQPTEQYEFAVAVTKLRVELLIYKDDTNFVRPGPPPPVIPVVRATCSKNGMEYGQEQVIGPETRETMGQIVDMVLHRLIDY